MSSLFRSALALGCALWASAAYAASPAFDGTQVAQGKTLYADRCAKCHGAHLEGVSAPALRASADDPRTVAETFTVASKLMPKDDPRSLSPDAYAAIVAYLLSENGCRAGAAPLSPADAAASTAQLGCAPPSVAGH
jgi:mono/diheme cytochrome c family protein